MAIETHALCESEPAGGVQCAAAVEQSAYLWRVSDGSDCSSSACSDITPPSTGTLQHGSGSFAVAEPPVAINLNRPF
jgi:hypothetical protein